MYIPAIQPIVEKLAHAEEIEKVLQEDRAAAEAAADAANPVTEGNHQRVTRGIKRDYRAMHNGLTIRAGGERAYSVRETILHALKNEMADVQEPKTLGEAMNTELFDEWQQAVNSEMVSIYKSGVWH